MTTSAAAAATGSQGLWFVSRGSGLVLLVLFSLVMVLGAATRMGSAPRRWPRFAVAELHHIVDPRTGYPARGPWRTVSVAAASCAEANAASTAAIIAGEQAAAWLKVQGLPSRLVAHDGSVLRCCGWPAADWGRLDGPPARLRPAGLGGERR